MAEELECNPEKIRTDIRRGKKEIFGSDDPPLNLSPEEKQAIEKQARIIKKEKGRYSVPAF